MKKNVFLLALLGLGFSGAASAAACTGAAANYNAGVGSQVNPAINAEMCICDAFAGRQVINGGSSAVVAAGAGGYIRTGIVLQCSANTMVSMQDTPVGGANTVAGVGMAGTSTRGNLMYVSNTAAAGGSTTPDQTPGICVTGANSANYRCSIGDVTAAVGRQQQLSIVP